MGFLALCSACITYETEDPFIPTAQANSAQPKYLEMPVPPDMTTFTIPEELALKQFAGEYQAIGTGVFAITYPIGSSNSHAAYRMASQVYDLLRFYGVGGGMINMVEYAAHPNETPPLVMAFTEIINTYEACKYGWHGDFTKTGQNRAVDGLGCAMDTNLVAMVANPDDLTRARRMEVNDLVRRLEVLDKYRQGQPTATKRSEEETGTVSIAVN